MRSPNCACGSGPCCRSAGTLPDAAGTAAPGARSRAAACLARTHLGSPIAVPALERLCTIFGLTSFERAALLLCAGVELDSSFATLCASADATGRPTFGLALAALPEPDWSAITPAGVLRRWRLIELAASDDKPILLSPIRIDERVLHYLVGIQYVDDRIDSALEPVTPQDPGAVAGRACRADRPGLRDAGASGGRAMPIVQLCGPDEQVNQAVASAVAGALGLNLMALWPEALPRTQPRHRSACACASARRC